MAKRTDATGESHRGRSSRAAKRVFGAILLLLVFVLALAAGVLLHVNLPATRRVVSSSVTKLLRSTFAGTISIEHIGSLGLGGVSGLSGKIYDPEGRQVLAADGIRVRIRGVRALRSVLGGKGDVILAFPEISIAHVDVSLDSDAAGNLRLANAFSSPAPAKETEPKTPGRGVSLDAPEIGIRHAWVHGQPGGSPYLDADLRNLAGRGHYDPNSIRANVDRLELVTRGLPRGADPKGHLEGRFQMPSATGKDMELAASFTGTIFGATSELRASLDGKRVDGTFDARDLTGEHVRAASELEIRDQVVFHAEAHGTLPRVAAAAHASLGRGTVDAKADLDLSDGFAARGTVSARNVDLQAVVRSAPSSDLGFDASADVMFPKKGGVSGTVSVDTLPGRIDGELAPVLSVRSDLATGALRATGRVLDERFPSEFTVTVRPEPNDTVFSADVSSKVPDLTRLGKKAGLVGSASADAKGTLRLSNKSFDVRATIDGTNVARGDFGADAIRARVSASGTADHPKIELGVHTEGLRGEGQRLDAADVRGRVELAGSRIVVHEPHVDVVRGGLSASILASDVDIGGARFLVNGAVITGVGEPIFADVSRDRRAVKVKIDAKSVDLGRLAVFAGRGKDVRAGTLAIQADAMLERDNPRGELHVDMQNLHAFKIEGGSLKADATVAERRIGLDLDADVPNAGHLAFHGTRLSVSGHPSQLASWKGVSGRVRFDGFVEMSRLLAMFPEGSRPPADLAGWLFVRGTVGRDSPTAAPEARVSIRTKGLVVAEGQATSTKMGKTEIRKEVGFRSSEMDVAFDIRVDGTSGAGEFAARVTDSRGALLSLDAKADLPYAELLADFGGTLEKTKSAPVSMLVTVPTRTLDRLPAVFGTKMTAGTVGGQLELTGTVAEPHLSLQAKAHGIRSKYAALDLATDTDLNLAYDGAKATLGVEMKSRGKKALAIDATAEAKVADLLIASRASVPWTTSAKAHLDGFPLDLVSSLADRRIRGNVTGDVVLDGLHKDAHLKADLALGGLRIGRADYEKGKISLEAGDGKLTAAARIDQKDGQKDGFLDLQASSGLAWGGNVVPRLDPAEPFDAHLVAKAFRASAILPFVQTVMNELDGRLDGDLRFAFDPRTKSATMGGQLDFKDGNVQIAAIGEEFEDAQAKVMIEQDGTIRVTNVEASTSDGHVSANAVLKMDGLSFAGANANLKIPDKKAIDLAVQGKPIGNVFGEASVDIHKSPDDPKKLVVAVNVPKFNVKLAKSLKTGVQELGKNEQIKVGVYRSPTEFVRLRLDKGDLEEEETPASLYDVDVTLGEVVVVRGTQARIVLTGHPRVSLDGKTVMSGQISVKSGKIDVQGKEFVVERGTVTFNPEDTANPTIVATATWTANDGTKVYADFAGPLKTGQLNLHSEPPRPKNELFALVLFGSADGMNASPTATGQQANSTTRAAAAVGGAVAAQGLTDALDDLTGIQATARIDTTLANNPRPEVEVQISRAISVQFAHVLGTPPITDPDTNLATIDWRFHTNWSLETTFGDRGKAVADAVWQKRY
ncbi:hypothetical protein AKJ09_01320 [Labilithrix luteola]|uniref:Translocation and assembly module TamB C-terminal domain-containing protein n=1 Tax=Labilithrix luteola TaxID=1391654 RepID=A0A0K1PML9_9BACT|nr:translocation/assembly module TamB domain-containing protein [Labilithrix luteola]AKU94656.1 hypothetical protein AKJ09_01320 [Labilithrix luteola]